MSMREANEDDAPSTRRVFYGDGSPAPAAVADGPMTWFSVKLAYVEPGYAASVGSEPKTYTADFAVLASTPDDAVRVARGRFDAVARESQVGWQRVITSIRCAITAGPESPPERTVVSRRRP